MAVDPVCGMKVKPGKAASTRVYNGQTYYFYASGCRDVFDTDPEKYLNRATEVPTKVCPWTKLFTWSRKSE